MTQPVYALNLFNVSNRDEYLACSRSDSKLADLHPHRVNGTTDYIWSLFDKLEVLRPILK